MKRVFIFFFEKKLNGLYFKYGCCLIFNIYVNEGFLKDRIKIMRK